ncbi:endonuclease domain-containing protein [Sphingomonas sp. DT-51]|uniref:endonuclease domain-containing protein n=1 Tax=Sphingomonas sp. DT-51 TaxID=3396165 RepID=UPI003F1C20FC
MRGNAQGLTKRQLLPADIVRCSRALRGAAGEPERLLWRAPREGLPAAKFRQQVPLGLYHADFCCHEARVIIEVDGDEHAHDEARDAARTRFLEKEGYDVMRFGNDDVMHNIDGGATAIARRLDHIAKGRP